MVVVRFELPTSWVANRDHYRSATPPPIVIYNQQMASCILFFKVNLNTTRLDKVIKL